MGKKSKSVEIRPLKISGRRWHNNNTNLYNYTTLSHLSRFSTSTADEFRSSKNHHQCQRCHIYEYFFSTVLVIIIQLILILIRQDGIIYIIIQLRFKYSCVSMYVAITRCLMQPLCTVSTYVVQHYISCNS